MNYTGGVDHHSHIAPVIERSGAEVPGIEVATEDDEFIGLFAAANFRDDVFRIHGTGEAIRHFEVHVDFLSGCQETRYAFGVLAGHDSLRQFFYFAIDGQRVAIEKQVGA